MNAAWVTALVVDADTYSSAITAGMLEGFGLTKQKVVDSSEAAQAAIGQNPYDLIICDASLTGGSAVDFIRWLRHLEDQPQRLVPVVVLTGYGSRNEVESVRNAGANVIVKKPMAANVLYDRLRWVAKGTRVFVESATYIGPDRRFKNVGLPGGVGRRSTDLSGNIGEATESNLSQDEIDMMVKPMKVDL